MELKQFCHKFGLKGTNTCSRLLAHNSWSDIHVTLKVCFQSKVSINPFMADEALLHIRNDFSDLDFDGKWRLIGDFHFKIEKWSHEEHSHPQFIQGYGG